MRAVPLLLVFLPAFAKAQDDLTATDVYEYGVRWTNHIKEITNPRFQKRVPDWFLPNLAGPFAKSPVKVGDIGFIATSFKIFQVVDERNVIIELADESNVWMSNINTGGSVDDMQAVLANPVIVTGNKTYGTVLGGQKTILAVRVIDQDVCSGALDLWQRSKWIDRAWTDVSGTYKVEAAMVDFDADKVKLKKPDGQVIEVELSKLSPTDRTWIKRNTLPLEFQKYLGN